MEKKIEQKNKDVREDREQNNKVLQKWKLNTEDNNTRMKLRGFEQYEANKYRYEADKDNRIRRACGVLRLEKGQGRNNRDQKLAGGKDRRIDDQGGHYIARKFGGSPELDNLFAQNGHFNQGVYKKMENRWGSYLEQKDKNNKPLYNVEVDIRSSYQRGSERPNKIFVYSKVTDNQGKVIEKKLYMFKNEYNSNQKERTFSEGRT